MKSGWREEKKVEGGDVIDTMATTMVHVACRSRAGAGCSLSVSTPRRLGLARDRRASLIRRKAGSENEDGSTRSEEVRFASFWLPVQERQGRVAE